MNQIPDYILSNKYCDTDKRYASMCLVWGVAGGCNMCVMCNRTVKHAAFKVWLARSHPTRKCHRTVQRVEPPANVSLINVSSCRMTRHATDMVILSTFGIQWAKRNVCTSVKV